LVKSVCNVIDHFRAARIAPHIASKAERHQRVRRAAPRVVAAAGFASALMCGVTAPPAKAQVATSCQGRPATPLNLSAPVRISGTALGVGAVYLYANAAPGIDVRVTILALNNGATLPTFDNDTGLVGNFQPELSGTDARSADFRFDFFVAGTLTPLTFDFVASAIDVDGNSNALREYAEFSTTQQVSYYLESPTRLSVNASGPSSATRRRFEATTTFTAAGISETETQNIVSAAYTATNSFSYRIGTLGTGNDTRLTSLDFGCPGFATPAPSPPPPQDFSDAPATYGNPVHDIVTGFRIGAVNTAETVRYANANAAGDTGDDGYGGGTYRRTFVTTANVSVTGAGGRLQGWIDWNGDGDFLDAGEQIATNVADNGAGDTNAATGTIGIAITAPANAVLTQTFVRFRWSTTLDAPPSTLIMSNGEVEDYALTILGVATLTAVKSSAVYDPSGTSPLAVPGNDLLYTINVFNTGSSSTDTNSVFVVDPLPAALTFFNGDIDGPGPQTAPVVFTQTGTGLTFNPATDVRYSNLVAPPANFAACVYAPAAGYDLNVRHICLNPKGAMASSATAPSPNFSVSFRAQIK
jgi:uncharacterized repeat protein (TIGR01451 family)